MAKLIISEKEQDIILTYWKSNHNNTINDLSEELRIPKNRIAKVIDTYLESLKINR